MKDIIGKLLTVKSLVTLISTVIFAVLSLRGDISGSEFLAVFTTVIGFYFGVQHERAMSGGDDDGAAVSD